MTNQAPIRPLITRLRCGAVALCALAVSSHAQVAPPAESPIDSSTLQKYDQNKNNRLDPEELALKREDDAKAALATDSETVVLSPFEVRTDKDTSYGALNSNSVSAFNMELFKSPVAADIFTQQFMQDVAVTSVEDLLNNYGAGTGQVLATPDSDANNNQPGDRFSVAQNGARGLTAGATRRDGFSASTTATSITDTFDTERVESIKGANALLFGASGAGGFVNTVSKQAKFGSTNSRPKITGRTELRIDQYGSQRVTFDANIGLKDIAVRFVLLDEDLNYRRLFLGSTTQGFYTALAAKLPFNTTLRLGARKVDNDRIISTRADNLSFTNATRDPRHNYALNYLLAVNKAGATDPVTGAAYPGGAIANGHLSWDNASSWSGWAQSEDINSETYTAKLDTVWTKWLSTSFAAMYDYGTNQRGPDGGTLTAPRAFNTANPLTEWANSSTFRMDRSASERHAYRGNILFTNELFSGAAKTQTVFGYDLNLSLSGSVSYRYYEADSNFRIYNLANPRPAGLGSTVGGTAAANALGRWELGTIYWPVGNGPMKFPYFRNGSRQVTINGRNYVLDQQNPRNDAFISALNPTGLATLAGYNVGGTNTHMANESKDYGYYGANYTQWMDERLTTLFGYRVSKTFKRNPNSSLTGTSPYTESESDNPSFNLGITYRLTPWLYTYYNIGKTFDPAKGSNDPLGNLPPDTDGFSQEIGFKFQSQGGKISGSLAYFQGRSKNENFNYGGANRDLINPVGINDAYNASQRNQWVNLDKESSGLELILTAAPTKNWRSRLALSFNDGKIKTASSFPIQWNDEFYYNRTTGGVTYADGTPFMVPTDTAGVAQVASANGLRAPVVGATNTQLTVAMMSDPNSDYYAYGRGATQHQPNGRITNNSVLFRALRWFQQPGGIQARTGRTGLSVSEIPYAFNDPIGYGGNIVLSQEDEPTVGSSKYGVNFTNNYDFNSGPLRGLGIGTTVRASYFTRRYWYQNGTPKRVLYTESDINPQVNAVLSYSYKIGRYAWKTQLNINNVFNKYKVELRPDGATGYTREENLGATFVGEPRQYVWTNSLAF
jgi:outer membrane receptor protein involved in Fe transport